MRMESKFFTIRVSRACSKNVCKRKDVLVMSEREMMLELIEVYCDSGRRLMIPENELEVHAPTLQECMEAYNEQGV